jgi:hypothetical protein
MLDQLSQYFYDPLVFWGAPLAIALVWAGLRRAAAWLARRRRARRGAGGREDWWRKT